MCWKSVVLGVAAALVAQSAQTQAPTRDPFCTEGQVQVVAGALILIQGMRTTLGDCLSDVSAASLTCQAAFDDTEYFTAKPSSGGESQFSCLYDYLSAMKPYDIVSSQAHMRLLNETGLYVRDLKSFMDTEAYRRLSRID